MGLQALDVVKVWFRGMQFGQRIIFGLTYECANSDAVRTVAVNLGEIVTEIGGGGLAANDVLTPYLAMLPASYVCQHVRAQRIKVGRSAYVQGIPAPNVGTDVNPATTATDAMVITRQSDTAGRGEQSSLHVGGVADAGSAAGLVVPGYVVGLTTLAFQTIAQLVMPVSGLILNPVIAHPPAAATTSLLTHFIVQPQLRIMGRRTVGRGE